MKMPTWIRTAKTREILPFLAKSGQPAPGCYHLQKNASAHLVRSAALGHTAVAVQMRLLILGVTFFVSMLVSLYLDFRGFGVLLASAAVRGRLVAEHWRLLTLRGALLALGLALIVVVGGRLIRSISTLQDSMLRIKRLEGMLPICAQCKRVRLAGAERTRQDSWVAIEKYIQDRTDAQFTHGLCPQCAHELYPALFEVKADAKSARA